MKALYFSFIQMKFRINVICRPTFHLELCICWCLKSKRCILRHWSQSFKKRGYRNVAFKIKWFAWRYSMPKRCVHVKYRIYGLDTNWNLDTHLFWIQINRNIFNVNKKHTLNFIQRQIKIYPNFSYMYVSILVYSS